MQNNASGRKGIQCGPSLSQSMGLGGESSCLQKYYIMIKSLQKITEKLFGAQHDFRVRLFNIMAAAGTLISLITGVSGFFTGSGLANFLLCMITMSVSAALLWYSFFSGKYQLCYMISCFCIFLVLFPALFFSVGGYHSGMPSFFIFAVVFTVFMLEGKKMVIITAAELSVYTAVCIFAYHYPDKINSFNSEEGLFIDIIIGFIVVSAALGITMALHLKIYNSRQNELEAARRQVEEYAIMKSELFAGMSHEMRTPLTVMSAYAQFAVEQIRESSAAGLPGVNEQTLADLATISDEAKRLAEMADGTLKILMTASAADKNGASRTEQQDDVFAAGKNLKVDMGALSSRIVRILEHVASRKGKQLSIVIKDTIPQISGDADALIQLVWNLLHNAVIHSDGKNIKLNIESHGFDGDCGVKVTVNDDGTAIAPELLPRIFDRGVSGRPNGSGIGLAICRDIAKRHGGDIFVQSGCEGTCVTVLLRGIGG